MHDAKSWKQPGGKTYTFKQPTQVFADPGTTLSSLIFSHSFFSEPSLVLLIHILQNYIYNTVDLFYSLGRSIT